MAPTETKTMPPNIDQERRVINDPNAPLPAKIAAAAVLWELIELATKALEPFKNEVRAVAVATGQPVVTLNGNGMSQCKVVLPGPSLRLNDGVTEEGELTALGDLFPVIYETKLTLRNASPAFIAPFPPNIINHIATVTTLVPSTPRVSLRSLSGVEEVK